MFCRWKILKKTSWIRKRIATCCDFLQKRRNVDNLQCFRFKIFDTTQCIRTAAILLTGCYYWPRLPSSIWQFLGFLQYWVVGHILTQNNCTNWIHFSKQYNSSGLVCLLFGDFRISMFLLAQRLRISVSESSKPHLIFFLVHFITILRFVKQNAPITCTCDITSFS